jgi:Ran GTPase-activating protein (RanGAP) involved in mRNA processing and transport
MKIIIKDKIKLMKTDNKNSRGLGYVTENCLIDAK